jgi:penicillin-binding protein 1A
MLPVAIGASAYDERPMKTRAICAALACVALLTQACALPKLADYQHKATHLPQTSFLYASNGKLITELHAEQDRVVLKYDDMPRSIKDAVVAIEDQRFWSHYGVDARAIVRAAYIDATAGRIVEGGSTITQQLVKQLYVGSDTTLQRKVDEAALAWQLEQQLTKQQILAKYLNTVYFGQGAYGVQAAARAYFGDDAKKLSLSQAATLAGLIAAPNDNDPFQHPVKARKRRNQVLANMQSLGMIGPNEYDHAKAHAIRLNAGRSNQRYPFPYFVDYAFRWFLTSPDLPKKIFGEPCPGRASNGSSCPDRFRMWYEGGLRITTTIDPRMQDAAERAVASVLPDQTDPFGALTAIDPRTGFVKAMVGGRNYWGQNAAVGRLNLATGGISGRQTGSAFKVFALVTALENGFTPSSPLNGSFASVPLGNGTVWQPQNAEQAPAGTVSLLTATVDSINIAYTNLEVALGRGNAFDGAAQIIDTARRMGLQCCIATTNGRVPLLAVPSAVLGSNETNTLEMASAYGTLADGGAHNAPVPISEIKDSRNHVLWAAQPQPRQAVDPRVVSVADDILHQVVLSGTGTGANIGRPQFGKTGTNQNYTDAWFVGAVPQLVTAVWVGFPQGQISMSPPRTSITVFGGTWPASIWHNFMAAATKRMPARDFPSPSVTYVTVRVDATQDPYCLPNSYTPPGNIKSLQFIAGTEPTRTCRTPTSAQLITVPSVIGLAQATAESRLRAAGFYVVVKVGSSTQPPGTVISQSPGAGTQAYQTSTVTNTVAKK